MSGFLGIVNYQKFDSINVNELDDTINLSCKAIKSSVHQKNDYFSIAKLDGIPLNEDRLFQTQKWILMFTGDIIEHNKIPFSKIVSSLETQDYQYFRALNVIYAISAYDKEKKKLYLISDRISMYPVFYLTRENSVLFSSEMATFCRLPEKFPFNPEWLWEYLYFNFPISDSSFLKKIKRLKPATILIYDQKSGSESFVTYAEPLKKSDKLYKGKESLEYASEIFLKRIPKYFEGTSQIVSALTGGWDCRTLVAIGKRSNNNIATYTYGIPGCSDLIDSRKTAAMTGLKHHEIHFNDTFANDLTELMQESIFLSSGQEKILRATLLYVYRNIINHIQPLPVIISGIAFSSMFRGHGGRIDISSYDLVNLFEGKDRQIRKDFWNTVIKADYTDFENHIVDKLQWMENTFGPFSNPENFLSNASSIVPSRYFCGEFSIARNFSTLRIPCLDSEIQKLAFSIEHSALSFSEFTDHQRGSRTEMVLQAFLLSKLAPEFAKIQINNTRPDVVLKGDALFHAYRIANGLKRRFDKYFMGVKDFSLLENWDKWISSDLYPFFNQLINNSDSMVKQYISNDFLNKAMTEKNFRVIGKLASIEIILRLIDNNWKKYW